MKASLRLPWLSSLGASALVVSATLSFYGCSSDDSKGGGGGTNTGASTTVGGQGGNNCFGCEGGGTVGNLTIVPPTATIDVVDGVANAVDFNAEVGGSPVDPESWVVNLSSVADTNAAGLVTASGNLGGLVTLKATYGGQTATATVTVNLHKTINLGGLTQSEIDLLKTPTGGQDASVVWAYPYDKTVFPKGLSSPELMWNGSAPGDKYLVHLAGPFTDFDVFTTAEPPSRHPIDATLWTQLTESGTGGTVDVKVNRLPAGAPAATTVIDHDWTVANGPLRGTVYYWANNLGRVMRIKPGAAAPDDFLAAAGVSDNCSTCHAVSANGSTLVIGGDTSTSTFDLLSNTPVFSTTSVGKPVRNWAMPAVSPDGSTLIENNAQLPGPPGGSDGMWDSHTGQKLTGLGLDGVMLDMPAFAPNGSRIAYVDHASHQLGSYAWDPVTKIASNPVLLADPGADPSLNAIAFPSVSPDAEWIVYHRGTYPQSLDTRNGNGYLYLASSTQPGVEVRLANLNGDTYPFAAGDRDRPYNYEPTFAPLEAGGYAWVVFTSRRTYGNRLTGGKDAVKQLWVAAIDRDPTNGVDPSHPAFLLPGQDLSTLNMRGFWALDPCKPDGAMCSTGSECCNQNCVDGVCEDPDPNGCSQTGNACMVSADCCDAAAECVNGFCSEPPPQ